MYFHTDFELVDKKRGTNSLIFANIDVHSELSSWYYVLNNLVINESLNVYIVPMI